MAGLAGSQPQNLKPFELDQPVPVKGMPPMPKVSIPVAGEEVTLAPERPAPQAPQAAPQTEELTEADFLQALGETPQTAPSGVEPATAMAQQATEDLTEEDFLKAMGEAPASMAQEPTPWSEASTLEKVGRVLDYPAGHARLAAAEAYSAVNMLLGKKPIVTDKDVFDAFKGVAPSSAELLARAGVSEGPSVMIPGTTKRVSLRDAEGFALDIATDPLTAISKMAKTVPYIKNLVGAGGKATEAIGDWIYSSAFKKVDAKLAAKGMEPLSGVMRQGVLTKEAADALKARGFDVPDNLVQGVVGTTASVADKAEAMSKSIGKLRQAAYDKATTMNAFIDLGDSKIFKNAESVIKEMKADPGLAPQAEVLQEMLERYKRAGKVSLEQASDFKTNLYDALPDSSFDNFGKIKRRANQFKLALAHDLKTAIVDTGNKADKGLGDAIDHINGQWGILLSARKPLEKQMQEGTGGKLGVWIDSVLLGSGQMSVLATKKAMDLATTTAARTYVGKALSEVGQSNVIDDIVRRSLAEQRGAVSPEIQRQEEQK